MSNIHPLYFLWQNKFAESAALLTGITAAVATAPVPTSKWGIWAYDWAHQVFNIKNTRLAKESIPIPPDQTQKEQQ